ncbi:ABC transporter ATP-binding protein [Chryseolinea sp. T2]|uniref:ABC transporter ATP-binding protein n=1 Tax=Chryseolinea sp. T2 TaxID=3129255 RepID=UPI003076A8FB
MKDKRALHLENVSHGYGNVEVLNNLNLIVNRGEIVVLVGPSGCGKTTILNLLSGFLRPRDGRVTKDGITRTVYQQDGLFPWLTVSENISMGLRSSENSNGHSKGGSSKSNEVKELIELIRMQGFENHYPHELSGGMKQRVELARVLAGESDILLMDEPFSALDYQSRLRMRRELILLLEKRPRTVVFVTHDIEEAAQIADRVLVLSNRPATICRELRIDASQPRRLSDPLVIGAMEEILKELGLNTPGTH